MRSIADELRDETMARVLALPLAERLQLALSLGDDDLERFASTTGLEREEARRRLRAARSAGRVPSVANALTAR